MTTVTTPFPAPVLARRAQRASLPVPMVVGLVIVAAFGVVALLAPLLAPADPMHQDIAAGLAHPSAQHLLGTDELGRDVFSRILFGTRVDLVAASLAAGGASIVGTAVGMAAGYLGGWVDVLLTRLMDMLQTIPSFTLLLVMLLVLGPGNRSLVLALVLTHWVVYARLTRSSVLVLRHQDFVAAAHLAGLGTLRILARHLLPNVGRQAVTYLASDVILAVTTIASLGYLGIGIQPPTPEWGSLINDGQAYLSSNWWLSVAPGCFVLVLGLGLALIADSVNARRNER